MIKIKLLSLILILPFIATPSLALSWQDSPEIAKIFSDAAVTGTFVVYDVTKDQFIGHNQDRAHTRYVPASTYKLPNSVIILATGAVKDVKEIIPYGGGTYDIKAWERDMNLADAIKVSHVPIYQKLARRVGMEKMQEYVQKFQYGNRVLGDRVDNFWLVGPIKISAIEQTLFLKKLAQGTLPIDVNAQKLVREITLLESGNNWTLHAKTGWYTRKAGKDIGWWVGWIEKEGQIYAFALNLDGEFNAKDLQNRVDIGKASLCALGLYPCNKE